MLNSRDVRVTALLAVAHEGSAENIDAIYPRDEEGANAAVTATSSPRADTSAVPRSHPRATTSDMASDHVRHDSVAGIALRCIDSLQEIISLVGSIADPAVKRRHLAPLAAALKRPVLASATVADLEAAGIRRHATVVRHVARAAADDAMHASVLEDCRSWWRSRRLPQVTQPVPLPDGGGSDSGGRDDVGRGSDASGAGRRFADDGRSRARTARERWRLVARYMVDSVRLVKRERASDRGISLGHRLARAVAGDTAVDLIDVGGVVRVQREIADRMRALRPLLRTAHEPTRRDASALHADLNNAREMLRLWVSFQTRYLFFAQVFATPWGAGARRGDRLHREVRLHVHEYCVIVLASAHAFVLAEAMGLC